MLFKKQQQCLLNEWLYHTVTFAIPKHKNKILAERDKLCKEQAFNRALHQGLGIKESVFSFMLNQD